MEASETDQAIVGRLAAILTGSEPGAMASEEEILAGEIDAAVDLLDQNQGKRIVLTCCSPVGSAKEVGLAGP